MKLAVFGSSYFEMVWLNALIINSLLNILVESINA